MSQIISVPFTVIFLVCFWSLLKCFFVVGRMS